MASEGGHWSATDEGPTGRIAADRVVSARRSRQDEAVRPINTKVVAADRVEELRTSRGTARAHVFTVAHGVSRAALILGHGRTSGIDSPDLATLAQQLPALGIEVVLLEQPWRVAGTDQGTTHRC